MGPLCRPQRVWAVSTKPELSAGCLPGWVARIAINRTFRTYRRRYKCFKTIHTYVDLRKRMKSLHNVRRPLVNRNGKPSVKLNCCTSAAGVTAYCRQMKLASNRRFITCEYMWYVRTRCRFVYVRVDGVLLYVLGHSRRWGWYSSDTIQSGMDPGSVNSNRRSLSSSSAWATFGRQQQPDSAVVRQHHSYSTSRDILSPVPTLSRSG